MEELHTDTHRNTNYELHSGHILDLCVCVFWLCEKPYVCCCVCIVFHVCSMFAHTVCLLYWFLSMYITATRAERFI